MVRGRWQFWSGLAVLGAGFLVGLGCDRRGARNFGVVKPGVLYRSGQLAPQAFERVLGEHQIKTVVTLRPARGDVDNSDFHEEGICQARGIKYVRLAPQTESSDPLEAVARGFLEVMRDPANYPVYVHCTAGRDRTGTMCAVFRMEHDRWSPEQALAEMRGFGFDPDKDAAATAYARYILSYRAEPAR